MASPPSPKPKAPMPPVTPHENEKQFLQVFAGKIPPTERLLDDFNCSLNSVSGKLSVTPHWLCFFSTQSPAETSMEVISIEDIETVIKRNTALVLPNAIEIKAKKKSFLFSGFISRDLAYNLITGLLTNLGANLDVRTKQRIEASTPSKLVTAPEPPPNAERVLPRAEPPSPVPSVLDTSNHSVINQSDLTDYSDEDSYGFDQPEQSDYEAPDISVSSLPISRHRSRSAGALSGSLPISLNQTLQHLAHDAEVALPPPAPAPAPLAPVIKLIGLYPPKTDQCKHVPSSLDEPANLVKDTWPIGLREFWRICFDDGETLWDEANTKFGHRNTETKKWQASKTDCCIKRKAQFKANIGYRFGAKDAECYQTVHAHLTAAGLLQVVLENITPDVTYGDSFVVVILLTVEELAAQSVRVTVDLKVKFVKSVFIKGLIESQTIAKLKDYYLGWQESAKARLKPLPSPAAVLPSPVPQLRRRPTKRAKDGSGLIKVLPDPIKNAPLYDGIAKFYIGGMLALGAAYFLFAIHSLQGELYKLQSDHVHLENRLLFLQSFFDQTYRQLVQGNESMVAKWEKWKATDEYGGSYSRLQFQVRELELNLANSGILLSELQKQLIHGQARGLQSSASSWLLWIFLAMLAGALGIGVLFFLPFVLTKLEKYQNKKREAEQKQQQLAKAPSPVPASPNKNANGNKDSPKPEPASK